MVIDTPTGRHPSPRMRRLVRSRAAWWVMDEAVWVLAVLVATGIRWLYVFDPIQVAGALAACVVAVVAHAAIGVALRLYRAARVRGSYDEVLRLVVTCLGAGIVLLVVDLLWPTGRFVPGTVPVLAGGLAVTGMLTLRLVLRAAQGRHRELLGSRTPVVIVGAGDAAQSLVRDMLNRPDAQYRPVALIDDDQHTHGGAVDGVPVVGGRESLVGVAGRSGARTVVLAVPSADAQTMRGLASAAAVGGLTTLTLPPLTEIAGQQVGVRSLRPLRLEDLLGRRSVEIDDAAVEDQLSGRVVLVTGAGGAIGAELCRQVSRFGAARVVLLDRDESAISAVMLDLRGRGLADNAVSALVDVQDREAMLEAFREHRPDVVLHAAGVQNLVMLERYPAQAWKNNVLGTLNVLEAAKAGDALVVVNVSSDTAQDPASVLGYSRLIAERLVAGYDERCVGRYLSVRVGNLVESANSIVRVFEMQISHGGPVTISHPEAAQRFMLVSEASRLVLQCAALSDGGDVMLLDAGEPVPLLDVAQAMMRLAQRPELEIAYTGARAVDEAGGASGAGRSTAVATESGRPAGATETWHPLVWALREKALDDAAVYTADERGEVTKALLRYVALGVPDARAVTGTMAEAGDPPAAPEALDWARVEREWAADEAERTPGDAFTSALLDLQRSAADRQADGVQQIVRATLGEGAPSLPRSEGESSEASSSEETSNEPIYLSKAEVGPLEEKWVIKALRSGYVAPLGPMVDEFERRVAERVGVKHALALSSGTAALHLLLLNAGARAGTYVVLPTMTFAATANAVMYTGATPFFVDVQESDANIDVDLMLQAVDQLQAEGKEVAAVVTVDLYGRCCDYTRIEPELEARGVPLIEDAAEALGASHRGRAAGSFGTGAALSFNGNKIMTTSGGGMLLSNDGDLVDRARYLSTQARQPVPWYEHVDVGFNYRMSNVLAGLGIAQLARLDDFIAHRRGVRDQYEELAAAVPGGRLLGRHAPGGDAEDNCWLTSLVWDVESAGETVDNVVARLGAERIEVRHLWKPLHGMAAYAGSGALGGTVARRLFKIGVNLPSGVGVDSRDAARTARLLAAGARGAGVTGERALKGFGAQRG